MRIFFRKDVIIAIKFFDMFAGIGGFRSGLEQAGGFEYVGFCEIDCHAAAAYRAIYDTRKEVMKVPNHLMNKLHFSGDQSRIDELLEFIKGEETVFDFNRVIPMPESLNIEAGSRTDRGLEAYKGFITVYTMDGTVERDLLNIPKEKEEIFLKARPDIDRDEWELGRTAFQNEQKYGAATWRQFHIAQWGSKWNAYQTEIIEDNTIEFNTAWTNVKPVIIALSQKFPDIEMNYRWADEDIDVNMGEVTFKNGECIYENQFLNGSKEAYEFVAEMWGLDLKEEGLIFNEKSGTYERQDMNIAESPTMG